ncbi:hypothetical protein BDP27DRAFT_1320734 [Rhodocollybia butyracea]|uniref:Uncharacterized protein n=1 Tax=Rhodocollybia butyracea TaxID=206335 RepID=A0A9P5UAS0_9AGAR|nr:hypothetical protein BDP27DRAFT_1320734 [Rhodocollybia butyracea]
MTQEFAALKTGSEAFLAEVNAVRTACNTDLLSFVHTSGTLSDHVHATSENALDEISSVSDLSVSSLGANVEKDDDEDYETVVPPSPGLNLNPTENSTDSKNVPVTQEASVAATPAPVPSVFEGRELENYAAGPADSNPAEEPEHAANAITSGATIPVSNGTHEVFSTITQFSFNAAASSSHDPRSNEAYGHFITGMNPVCTELPKSKAGRKAVRAMCRTAIPHAFSENAGATILKHPEALFAQPNNQYHTLITVSREARDPTAVLKKVNPNWCGHLLVQSSLTGYLFYLGQYQGGASQRITVDEYHSLPEETKNYVLNCFKAVRPRKISTQEQLLLSLEKADGVYVAKTELRFVDYSTAIEANLRADARQKGYVTDI